MSTITTKARRIYSGLAGSILLLGCGLASAQSVVNLTAGASTTTLPDGQVVPMWGYTCTGASTTAASPATPPTCVASNPNAGTNWSPVVITVPYSGTNTTLTINLTNNLSFKNGNTVPTSLFILGQVGGGLGGGGTTTASPTHATQSVTWPTANTGPTNTPLPQLPRVQSFGTEVAAGASAALCWGSGCPGPSGAASPPALKPGTYLIESGTHPSIQATMGLYGILVVTNSAVTTSTGSVTTPAYTFNACTSTNPVQPVGCDSYDANAPVLLGEIDPAQNIAVDAAVNTAGFSATTVWSGQPGQCGNPQSANYQTCYPPTVNYSPRYYLINGVSFDRTSIGTATANILAPAAAGGTVTPVSGNVMLNFVNAGSRMHVPAMVGLPFTLVAEDGNPLPGLPRTQNEVFLPAGKSYDILVKPAQSAATSGTGNVYTPATYPVFDRALGLSTNNQRDGGMQAYIAVAGGAPAGSVGSASSGTAVTGVGAKTYYCAAGSTLVVTDPAKGVLGGSSGANGAALYGMPALPGTLSFNSNGTFAYTPPASGACGGTFQFTVNAATTPFTATIAQCDATAQGDAKCQVGGAPTLANDSYTGTNAKFISISPPGVLLNDTDPSGLPLKVDLSKLSVPAGVTVAMNVDGSFEATASSPGTYTFTYNVKNQQGTPATASANVSLTFPAGSGLQVKLVDDKDPTLAITDYRWIIEEDDTYWTDPKCQVNVTPRPTDSYGRACPPLPVESIGYNFHTSNMKVVATGCVGDLSCEVGQTITLNGQPAATVCDIGNGICRTDGSATKRTQMTPDQVALDPTKHYYISVMPGDAVNPTKNAAGGPVQVDPTCDPSTTGCAMRQFSPALDCSLSPNGPPDPAKYAAGTGKCGHNMGGHQIPPQVVGTSSPPAVTIALAETPLPTAQIAVFVYEDDYPLNGENDAGGGVDILAPNEAGLGSFQVTLLDQGGQFGDNNGQPTYDMFNMPLGNSLAGTLDPNTSHNACPITSNPDGIVGMIVTCPDYEDDGVTRSPLAGQAVIKNLYPGLYEVAAVASADRIARGEEWIQTNTLDGGKPHEAFIRPGEPSYFQEFGPGGFHVQIGFANPKIINDRRTNSAGTGMCDPAPTGGGLTCNSTLSGQVHGDHMSRTPDERTYDTGSYDAFAFSHCYVSIGIPDAQDFAFTKCDAQGNFSFTGLPDGVYKMAVFDQWNDIMLDGLIAAVTVNGATTVQPTVIQWRTNLYTRSYLDVGDANGVGAGNGIPDRDVSGADLEPGLALLQMNVRYRDGSIGFKTSTDLNGYATNNEIFPFMNWLVVQPDTTRFKPTGVHVIYDAGGPDDCSDAAKAAAKAGNYTAKCSKSAHNLAGTLEQNSLPAALRIPGAVYCVGADCSAATDPAGGILNGTWYAGTAGSSGPIPSGTNYLSSGRIDPPWMITEGFQGLLGQHNFIDFGFKPYKAATSTTPAENGGISGTVVYASTRPFDDPQFLVQNNWEPLVPNVQVNLYQESTNADGFTTLKLVDTTLTSSWDKWAQGFRTDGTGTGNLQQVTDNSTNPVTGASNNGYIPNMSCPGQASDSPFFQTLQGSKEWLDSAKHPLAYNSQFKCFDGWSVMNQIQPAPFDGKYQFPSVVDRDPKTGKPSGTGSTNGVAGTQPGSNCTICIANPDDGTPMLPAGKYVVEVVVPSGWELVKEEDKNILIGDIFIAPVTQQFAGLGNVFILPDQAAMNGTYNANNAQNSTLNLNTPVLGSDFAAGVDQVWPCVGTVREVPNYLSLFPGVQQVAPFAGASRPLCDRKELTVSDQMQSTTKFFIYTKNHIAGHFTGMMTNDMASEFDPFSPQFGEKFGAANLPVNMRDFMGTEMSRVYGDQWGVYNGLYFSSWEVNPPNPTGYAPQMSIACMNDPGPIPDPSGTLDPATGKVAMIVDPAYNPAYSNFCYEQAFMPGMTNYMDTPVTPVMAFADHYNLPDAEYPNGTPMVKRADFKGNAVGGIGPWSSNVSDVLTLQSVGDMAVQNPQYTGPSGNVAPYNTKTVTRHYGFGTQCTAIGGNCLAISSVTIGGVQAIIDQGAWSDTTISAHLPVGAAVPNCALQQQGNNQKCGEVVITAGNGMQSFTGITATFGGNKPTVVNASSPTTTTFGEFFPNPLQAAIDKATPGDLLIIDAGSYHENLIMWKPVRLQGVGAASVTINADAHPAGKMDPWRRRVDCLFGLTMAGWTNAGNNSFDVNDPSGTNFSCPDSMFFRDDRLPFEGFVGWDASSNGNLAQVLQEPSLMGAYEGAGITVVGRGIRQPVGTTDLWGQVGGAGTYVDGSVYLTKSTADCTATTGAAPNGDDYGTGNFNCNPSGVDGVTITNSSQGGGGIYLHGWNNNFQIANDRIIANAGTLSGGINIGNGESPPVSLLDNTLCGNTGANPAPLCPPIPNGTVLNQAIPSQLQTNVHVHHNQVIDNASIGDALFSGSPAGAGGITISAGSDGYEIDHNWVAGNLTSSDGGGIAHMGLTFNGKIHNNVVLFNEANNPTLSVDGGGIIVMGAQEDRTLVTTGLECGGNTDVDCPPGIGDGTGPGLVIDSNLILGNSAAYGSGGGLRLRQVNGTEVALFPRTPNQWYGVTVTNNIITNNVAGWDGAGVSIQDSFRTDIINNTIVANDTTASAGVLFKTLGAIDQASPAPGCLPTPDPMQPQAPGCLDPNAPHIPQPAGLVTMQNTPNMMASLSGYVDPELGSVVLPGNIQCPVGYGYGDTAESNSNSSVASRTNGRCLLVSLPKLVNNMFWQNRAFHVEMVDSTGAPLANQGSTSPNGTGLMSQQNIIALLPEFTQKTTGQCIDPTTAGPNTQLYWDVGVRMDTLPNANGHALVFNAATVGTGYNLEGAVTVALNGGSLLRNPAPPSAQNNPALPSSPLITDAGGAYSTAPTVTLVGGGPSLIGTIAPVVPATVPATSTLTVTSTGAPTLAVGTPISGIGIAAGTTVRSGPVANVSGQPTYTISGSQTVATDETITYGVVQGTVTVTVQNGLIVSATIGSLGSGYTGTPTAVLSGGGMTPNLNDQGYGTNKNAGITLTATNSIFSDTLNSANVFGSNNLPAQGTTTALAPAGGAGLLVGQYCNGARIPPEQCGSAQGANNPAMCLGFFAPAGISENVGVPQVFRFANIAATATVDEGNNWINMSYGPLTLSRPLATQATSQEQIVTVAGVGSVSGAYSLPANSPAINKGTNTGAPKTDFYGNPRPLTASNQADIGAVEFQVPPAPIANLTTANNGSSLNFGLVNIGTTSAAQTLVLHNTGNATLTGIQVAYAGPYATGAGNNLCGPSLAPNSTCNIAVVFKPISPAGAEPGSVTVTATNATVTNGVITLSGTAVAAGPKVTVTPSSENFGPVKTGASSARVIVSFTNSGTVNLTGLTDGALSGTNSADFTIYRPFSTCGPTANGQPLGVTTLTTAFPLNACIVTVQFTPKSVGSKTATLTVNTNELGPVTVALSGTAN